MSRLLRIAETSLCFSGTALLVCACALILSARTAVQSARQDEQLLAAKAGADLDELHRLTLEAGLTAMEARKASALEEQSLTRWNQQATQLLTNANGAVRSLTATSDSVRSSSAQLAQHGADALDAAAVTVRQLQPVETNLAQAAAGLSTTEAQVNALVGDPHLKASLAHLDTTTGAAASMASDTAQAWHRFLHPKWPARVLGYFKDGAVTAGKILLP